MSEKTSSRGTVADAGSNSAVSDTKKNQNPLAFLPAETKSDFDGYGDCCGAGEADSKCCYTPPSAEKVAAFKRFMEAKA